jgi:hypothetical protein
VGEPSRTLKIDPRNLARIRTQVWFAEMALKAMMVEAMVEPDTTLTHIVHLLELAEIKLSDMIDQGQVVPVAGA